MTRSPLTQSQRKNELSKTKQIVEEFKIVVAAEKRFNNVEKVGVEKTPDYELISL